MAPYKIADNTIHVSKSCSKKDTHTTAVHIRVSYTDTSVQM